MTIQVHSSADADSLAVRMADVSVNIGPPQAAKSYLNIGAILEAAKATGADAVHPGYGFLSENAAFADEVEAAGLVFVGPTGATIRTMGDKAAARGAAQKAGVPVVPGSSGRLSDLAQAIRLGDEIGYPLMIKAAAGGGGRGIRIAQDKGELEAGLDQARGGGQGGVRRRQPLSREVHPARPPYRGADSRRRRPCRSLL